MSSDQLQDPLLDAPIKAEEPKQDAKRTKMLLLSFLAMIVVGLGNKIFQVLMTKPMYNYALFNSMLTTFIYLPTSFAYIIPMLRKPNVITPEAQRVPKWKFAVMGILDSIAGIMQVMAVSYLENGSLVILLTQAAIPISMAISRVLLKAKYKRFQYIGAIVVVCGIALVLVPKLIANKKDDEAGGPSSSELLAWACVLILSCVPMCLSSVFKEIALGETEIDVVYLNGWIAVFQFLGAFPLLPPSAIASSIKVKDIPKNLLDGWKCFTGINTIMGGKHPDKCAMGPVYVPIYMVFNLGYNILIILILKFGDANLLWLAMTIMVPLGNFAFALPFMPDRKTLKWNDLVGLLIILSGLIVYRFWGSISKMLAERKAMKAAAYTDAYRPVNSSAEAAPVAIDLEDSIATPHSPAIGQAPSTPALGLGVHRAKGKKKSSRASGR